MENTLRNAFPKRKNPRLKHFDYNTPCAYFITFCTCHRKNTLSRIVGAIHESPVIQLSAYGKIADKVIRNIPPHLQVRIEYFVIMPNHIHLVVTIPDCDTVRAIRESPLRGRSIISKTVGYIKMNISKEIHQRFGDATVWQRGFHDHIIRNEQHYLQIATYVQENPLRWQQDCFYCPEK